MRDEKEEQAFLDDVKLVAPGTLLYEGLENILRARTGALIVIGNSDEMLKLVNGGFRIDSDLNPAALYELAKMDGALVLSSDVKRILYANAQLIPDPMIPSFETGTRHRTAERVAKQTNEVVIAISQRRNVITIYRGNRKFVLREISVLLTKANQALSTLEKHRSVLEQSLTNLSALEFEGLATLLDVASVIQRSQMVARIAAIIEQYVSQLGDEGRLVNMQLEELTADIEDEGLLVVRDYVESKHDPDEVWRSIAALESEELLNLSLIVREMGYSAHTGDLDHGVTPKGWRILRKIPRLPMPVVKNLLNAFDDLPAVLNATIAELDEVEGIGEVRAKAIKEGLRRLKEQVFLDRQL